MAPSWWRIKYLVLGRRDISVEFSSVESQTSEYGRIPLKASLLKL